MLKNLKRITIDHDDSIPKEQVYLFALQNVAMLRYTPSPKPQMEETL